MALIVLRWGFAGVPLAFAARASLRQDLIALGPHWTYVLAAESLGFTAFSALFYVAAHRTTAGNISILQGLIRRLSRSARGSHSGCRRRRGKRSASPQRCWA
jgi:hypothetical protein